MKTALECVGVFAGLALPLLTFVLLAHGWGWVDDWVVEFSIWFLLLSLSAAFLILLLLRFLARKRTSEGQTR